MCQCYQIGGPFIAEDLSCPAHGVDGYAGRLEAAEARIAELEAVIRDELVRRSLISIPRKLEFMRERGIKDLDGVHGWMLDAADRLGRSMEK